MKVMIYLIMQLIQYLISMWLISSHEKPFISASIEKLAGMAVAFNVM